MKFKFYRLFLSLMGAALCTPCLLLGVEPGFIPLLDRDHTDGWRLCGAAGGANVSNGVLTINPAKVFRGFYWYAQRQFKDFTLLLDYKLTAKEGNSGIALRFPYPGNNHDIAENNKDHYHVDVSNDPDPLQVTGAMMFVQAPSSVPQKMYAWNQMEVTVTGQQYVVKVNGKVVNDFTGDRSTSGFLGLQLGRKGVQFTNIRIKDLSSARPAPVAAAGTAATVQTDANQPRIEVLKDQGLNAMEWALAPLDQPTPPNIRQNLIYLREDLLDESKQNPKGSSDAYALAAQFCQKILAALAERSQAGVLAGYTAAQADADMRVTSAQLEVRRNYMMSWPQFAREESQREEIARQQMSEADLKKERSKVAWAARAAALHGQLDNLYRQFRENLR